MFALFVRPIFASSYFFHGRSSLPGPQPPLPVPPSSQGALQPARPLQAVRPRDVGQPLHPHRRVFRRTPGLTELPLWRHLHPSALLTLPVVLSKQHPHPPAERQERLQETGHFHLPEAILRGLLL